MKIIIIGAGPGGYETAAEAAKRGLDVTLISEGPLGGTCLNEGCIPTKTFCHIAELQEAAKTHAAASSCGTATDVAIQIASERKNEVIKQLQSGIEILLKKVNVVYGHAKLIDNHSVKVLSEQVAAVETAVYSADKIIIATGSVSASLPIPGAELAVTSKEMLELTEVPKRLCIIGGGVIGLEFASIYKAFGSEVTVLEYCPGILPRFDVDIAKRLKSSLVKSGIAIETSAQVKAIEKTDNALSVKYLRKDAEQAVEADLVLMAVGRRPNTAGLGVEALGLEMNRAAIKVDENMQTSVPDVYAVGDVTGGIMLAHYASAQGKRALNHICGVKDNIRFDICPAVVFTTPELATVGLSEEDCKAAGIEFTAHKSFYRANGKAVSMGETEGYCKILSESASGKILGAHILGTHASDLISELAALLNFDATIDQAKDIIHAHPTLSEIIQSAVNQ